MEEFLIDSKRDILPGEDATVSIIGPAGAYVLIKVVMGDNADVFMCSDIRVGVEPVLPVGQFAMNKIPHPLRPIVLYEGMNISICVKSKSKLPVRFVAKAIVEAYVYSGEPEEKSDEPEKKRVCPTCGRCPTCGNGG